MQSVQDKAWVAGNGYSLVQTHNAVLDVLRCSLRARQEGLIRCVVAFEKGIAISCKLRLAAKPFLTRCIHQLYVDDVLAIMKIIMSKR